MTLKIEKRTAKNFVLILNERKILVPVSYVECDNQDGTVDIKKAHQVELCRM